MASSRISVPPQGVNRNRFHRRKTHQRRRVKVVELLPQQPAESVGAPALAEFAWWLAWLAASLALTNSGQPTELVPTSAWDIGDFWITRRRNIPILFVRRLHRDATLKALREALQKRAGRSGGLILTSSRNPLRQDAADRPFVVVPIAQAMTNDSQVFAIDRTLLLSAAGDRATEPPQRSRRRPTLERARGVIKELYPNGVPDQATEPNAIRAGHR
jgi:hypothetical protein